VPSPSAPAARYARTAWSSRCGTRPVSALTEYGAGWSRRNDGPFAASGWPGPASPKFSPGTPAATAQAQTSRANPQVSLAEAARADVLTTSVRPSPAAEPGAFRGGLIAVASGRAKAFTAFSRHRSG
jgi:hypothetical protein